jgi:hypothetical protein
MMSSSNTSQQEMFLLAFASNAGASCEVPHWDTHKERQLLIGQCVQTKINEWFTERGLSEWEIVWGPGVYLLSDKWAPEFNAKYPTNVIVVAYNQATLTYLVSVAGTNSRSYFDIFTEDLGVGTKKPWPYAQHSSPVPEISSGSHKGLTEIQEMKPVVGPIHDVPLDVFLGQALEGQQGTVKIITAGHSLGGALSPLVALWLLDTQSEWNTNSNAQLDFSCFRYAGPTPGDEAFQSYYNGRVPNTTSVSNSLDIVPKAWNLETMKEIPDIYQPEIPCDGEVLSLIEYQTHRAASLNYQQVGNPSQFTGSVFKPPIASNPDHHKKIDCQNFTTQVMYQHIPAYFEALELTPPPPFTESEEWIGCRTLSKVCG